MKPFLKAYRDGDEKKATELYERNKSALDMKSRWASTGLTWAIDKDRYSICRWLLSLPDIDVNMKWGDIQTGYWTALHRVPAASPPLDLIISLVRLASKETINMKCTKSLSDGLTALDFAFMNGKTSSISTAIYLSWLGANC